MKKFIFFIIMYFCFACDYNARKKKLYPVANYPISTIRTIDIDSLESSSIKRVKFLEHRSFTNVGEIDSVRIAPNLLSILAAVSKIEAKNDYQSDVVLSNFKIYIDNTLLFKKDSILAVSPFEYNSKSSLLSFLIIKDQNADTFATTSDLYVIDTKSKKALKLKENLTNSANAEFSTDGESVFYLNENALFKYTFKDHVQKKEVNFLNSGYLILNLKEITPCKFRMIYLKDISSGELFTSTFSFSEGSVSR